MIKIDFQEPTSADWKEWRRECDVARDEIARDVANGGKPEITDLYKDSRMRRVYKSNGAPFYGKCVYCESDILVNHPGDIEHWRPKNRVTDDDEGRPIMIRTAEGATRPHPGYYWLAYDWRNLLFACEDCNRPSTAKTPGRRIGKWDQFPVDGFRATTMGEESDEYPVLLNPVQDEPEDHLEVDNAGVMIAKTVRGQKCIDIFGLNAREALLNARKDCIENTENALLVAMIGMRTGNRELIRRFVERCEKVKSGAAPYTACGRAVLRKCGLLQAIVRPD